jgi:hypothetical protein
VNLATTAVGPLDHAGAGALSQEAPPYEVGGSHILRWEGTSGVNRCGRMRSRSMRARWLLLPHRKTAHDLNGRRPVRSRNSPIIQGDFSTFVEMWRSTYHADRHGPGCIDVPAPAWCKTPETPTLRLTRWSQEGGRAGLLEPTSSNALRVWERPRSETRLFFHSI